MEACVATPNTTTWKLDPHTRAKHEILGYYMKARTPILSLGGFPTIAYVDGFAGPGVYSNGEDGSPIIALKAALEHQGNISANVLFLFIERHEERAKKLEQRVARLVLPKNFHVKIVGGRTFEQGFREYLIDFYKKQRKGLPPTFAFIDPFGWTGVPFDLVKEILSYSHCEVLINFMFEEINRFIEHRDQGSNFDALFGTAEWRRIETISDKKARREFLHGLYLQQLRGASGAGACAKYVRSFEMRNDKDVTDYFLFFATNSPKGMAKMKEAMWKVDQSGEFRFSDATNPNQALLFTPKPDFDQLMRVICSTFAGTTATVAAVEDFVLAETPYRETHYKRQVLLPLERSGKVTPVDPPASRKPGTYADPALKLRFV
jgi:three-Cys-motif partner protein